VNLSPFDLFLQWLSERGAGRWDAFREAHAWLFSELEQQHLRSPSSLASRLQALGHLEVDWENARWSIAAPCLVGLPSAGATAVLTGSRPSRLLARFRALVDRDEFADVFAAEYQPWDAPSSVYLEYGSHATIEAFAKALGVTFEPYPAERLSRLLPHIADVVSSSPITPSPPVGYAVEYFDAHALTWDAAVDLRPGLYRYRAFWSDRYRLWQDGVFREVDRDIGQWAAMTAARVHGLRFESAGVNGALVTSAVTRLPSAYARTAVLCSGLPPHFDVAERSLRYDNVPRALAERIAAGLAQKLDA
jgi:hypothetical protein